MLHITSANTVAICLIDAICLIAPETRCTLHLYPVADAKCSGVSQETLTHASIGRPEHQALGKYTELPTFGTDSAHNRSPLKANWRVKRGSACSSEWATHCPGFSAYQHRDLMGYDMLRIGELRLYDVTDLAQLLGLHEKTVRALLRAGKIKGKKLAKKWYVREDDLHAFFEASEPR